MSRKRTTIDRTADIFAAGLAPEDLTLLGSQEPAGETYAERVEREDRARVEATKQRDFF